MSGQFGSSESFTSSSPPRRPCAAPSSGSMRIEPSASSREWTRIPVFVRYVPGSLTLVDISVLPSLDLRRQDFFERDAARRFPEMPVIDDIRGTEGRGAVSHHDRSDARCVSEMTWRTTPELDERHTTRLPCNGRVTTCI